MGADFLGNLGRGGTRPYLISLAKTMFFTNFPKNNLDAQSQAW